MFSFKAAYGLVLGTVRSPCTIRPLSVSSNLRGPLGNINEYRYVENCLRLAKQEYIDYSQF